MYKVQRCNEKCHIDDNSFFNVDFTDQRCSGISKLKNWSKDQVIDVIILASNVFTNFKKKYMKVCYDRQKGKRKTYDTSAGNIQI